MKTRNVAFHEADSLGILSPRQRNNALLLAGHGTMSTIVVFPTNLLRLSTLRLSALRNGIGLPPHTAARGRPTIRNHLPPSPPAVIAVGSVVNTTNPAVRRKNSGSMRGTVAFLVVDRLGIRHPRLRKNALILNGPGAKNTTAAFPTTLPLPLLSATTSGNGPTTTCVASSHPRLLPVPPADMSGSVNHLRASLSSAPWVSLHAPSLARAVSLPISSASTLPTNLNRAVDAPRLAEGKIALLSRVHGT